ncbi:hypothetical protein B6U64_07410 [Ligilactobacillus salivarius]|uniref:HamA C-terminal domain-containing protein n=1 Tax=Ligilactobacillus salivarius TaxID=1624 RepID=UPI0009DA4286|nr:DUF1837 domain-containing protein [Ligilactobacillus salivarius]OQQ75358.1 hypothetical protein B6U64_07410 [Ligilactobacillus salivarius]
MEINRFQVLVDALRLLSEIDGTISNEAAVIAIFDNYTKNWNVNNYQESNYKKLYYQGINASVVQKLKSSTIDEDKFKQFVDTASDDQKYSISNYLFEELKLNEEPSSEKLSYFCVNLMSKLVEEARNKKRRKRKQKIPTQKSEDKIAFVKTVSDEMFASVFHQVNVSEIDIVKNRNSIHAFVLKPELLPFRYKNLRELAMSNITNYAVARGVEKTDITGLKAGQLLRRYVKSGIPSNLLGELLTYIFLEHEENALKLYTRAEISAIDRTIDSEGMYLKSNGERVQLILGASQLNNSLQEAVDNVVEKLSKFKNNQSDEMMLATDIVDMTILNAQLGETESQAIIRTMIPNESGLEEMASYGLFIGYQFKTEQDLYNCTQDEAKKICRQTVNNDLQQAISQLGRAIQQHHWQKSSFYVYLLPFTEAEEDSRKIMNDLIGG